MMRVFRDLYRYSITVYLGKRYVDESLSSLKRCHAAIHLTVGSIFSSSRYCGSSEWGSSYTDTDVDLHRKPSSRAPGCTEPGRTV